MQDEKWMRLVRDDAALHKGVLQMGVRLVIVWIGDFVETLLDDLLDEGGNNSRAFPTPP
jgi:hypothetical protein